MHRRICQADPQRAGFGSAIRSRTCLTQVAGILLFSLMAFTLTSCISGGGAPGVSGDAANLAGLEVLNGAQAVAISPAFDSASTVYSVSVGGGTTTINIRATAAEPKATIRINNTAAVSGQVFGPIPVNAGTNTINVVVDAPGAVKAYTLTVFRGTNANLAQLSIAPGSLAESFDPNLLIYSATVGTSTTAVTVTATVADTTSTLTIKGQTVSSGQPSAPIGLVVGLNAIDVVVTPLSGPTKTYVVNVTRSASPIADLAGIVVVNAANNQNLTYTPAFSAGTLAYTTQTVAFSVSSVRITATVADPTSTLAIQPPGQAFQSATSGVAFGPIALPSVTPALNTIAIRVTAQTGTIKTYTVTVPRSPASTNNNLQSLTLSSGTLFPAFNAANLTYHVSVTNAVTTLTITGTAQDATARVGINNQPPTLGSANAAVPVTSGVAIPIVVIAENGDPKTYTVTVNRDANLSALSLSSGSLQPGFNASTLAYTASVLNTTTSVTVTANVQSSGATMAIGANGSGFTPLPANTPSAPITLNVGANTITVRVTAPVGSSQDYVVTVTRAAPGNANLASLTLSSGTLTPAFTPSTSSYTVNVANSVATLTVAAAAQDVASTTVSLTATPPGGPGQPSPLIISPLGVGTTTVTILVTHTAGNSQSYTLTITKNSADLSSLTVSTGTVNLTLTPTFSSGQVTYVAAAPPATTQVTVIPTPAVLGSTVTVNGNPPATPVTLVGPSNPISIVVTPSTGPPSTTYTVTVNR